VSYFPKVLYHIDYQHEVCIFFFQDMRERDDVITQLRADLVDYGRRYRALLELTTKLLERQSGSTAGANVDEVASTSSE